MGGAGRPDGQPGVGARPRAGHHRGPGRPPGRARRPGGRLDQELRPARPDAPAAGRRRAGRRRAELPRPGRGRPADRRPRHLLRARPPGDRAGAVRGPAHADVGCRAGQLALGAAARRGQRLCLRRAARPGHRRARRAARAGRDLMPGARVVTGELPLSGLRVVELCDTPAGEYTGKLLADLGAEVVKVEPPGGAASRRHGPYVEGTDVSLAFWAYNTSKRSVVLDDSPAGRAARDRLIARADVLLATTPPAGLAAAGLDYDALTAAHPRLVAVSVTAFGLTGPWADYRSTDLVALAAG